MKIGSEEVQTNALEDKTSKVFVRIYSLHSFIVIVRIRIISSSRTPRYVFRHVSARLSLRLSLR